MLPQTEGNCVQEDNQAAIALCNHAVFHSLTKHVCHHSHYLCQSVKDAVVFLKSIKLSSRVLPPSQQCIKYIN
jgi:hypothetical protein